MTMIDGHEMEITPTQARAWLGNMVDNMRNHSPAVVDAYARLFASGGEIADPMLAIAIDEDGRLADGQHRLMAIAALDRPVRLFVRFNVNRRTLMAHANTKPRSISDQLVMSGSVDRTYAWQVASVGRLLWFRRTMGKLHTSGFGHKNGTIRLNADDITEVFRDLKIDANRLTDEAIRLYRLSPKRTRIFPPSAIGYLLAQNPPEIVDWLESLVSDEADRTDGQIAARRYCSSGDTAIAASKAIFAAAVAFNDPSRKRIVAQQVIPDLKGGIFDRGEESLSLRGVA